MTGVLAVAVGWSLACFLFILLEGRILKPGGGRAAVKWREKRMEKELPAVLDRLAAGLSAGFSLQQSLEDVSAAGGGRVGELFRSVLRRVRAGSSLDQSLEWAGTLHGGSSLPLALHTMAEAYRSGSNLVESLNLLAYLCRERQKLRRKVAAMTAQGRMQGMILILIPLLFMAALYAVSPGSFRLVLDSPAGRGMLTAAALLQGAGSVIIHHMVHRELF